MRKTIITLIALIIILVLGTYILKKKSTQEEMQTTERGEDSFPEEARADDGLDEALREFEEL